MSQNCTSTYFVIACVLGSVILFGFSGCDTEKEQEPICEVINSPTGLYCHYEDPFTYTPECKAYINTGWDAASINTDCESPMGAAGAAPGEVNEIPCDGTTSLGSCLFEVGPTQDTLTWFYDYEDVNAFRNGCVKFQGGTFCYNVEQEEATTSSDLLPEAVEASKSNAQVTVTPDAISDDQRAELREDGGYIFFEPANPVSPAVGISLYPGGRIDARSFAPAAQMLAKLGYYVAIFPMPDYMALGDAINRADKVTADHPDIAHWLATGHSIGGTAAGQYVYDKIQADDADKIVGLVIMGSYLDEDHDLSGEDIPVLMMFGTEERVANADKNFYDDAKAYLPADAIHFPIEDGFHFGFCFSENPRDDEEQLITHQAQHDIYVPRIVSFIEDILGG